jgi:predicted Zn-dependent peptidase
LAENLEAIGAHISGGASHDSSHASCHAVADYFPETLELFAEALLKPAHAPTELEKEKIAQLASIKAKRENIFSVAQDILNPRLFEKHPYASPTIGFEPTVLSLSSAQTALRHQDVVVPNGAVLSLATPMPSKAVSLLVKKLFGPSAWAKSKARAQKIAKTPTKPLESSVSEQHPFEQAYLMIGFPAVDVKSPDYVTLKVIAAALGGGMSSRLFQSLREERALAYDVGSYVSGRKAGSSFVVYMGLQASKLDEAKREIQNQLLRIQRTKMSNDELTGVKNYFKGSFILDHQTNSQRAYYLAWSLSMGRGLNYDRHFLSSIDSVTPSSVLRVAKTAFAKPRISVEILPK